MARAHEYEALLRAALRHDTSEVLRIARLTASNQRAAGHVGSAASIERIIHSQLNTIQQPLMRLGRDKSATAVAGIEPRCKLTDLVLTPETKLLLDGIFAEQRAGEQLADAGLAAASRLLLHGPPGLGKTSLAHAIASELQLPLLEVLLEGVVDSHLGESSKNLHEVWQFIRPQRCVVLIDEIDALCMRRGVNDSGAGQETSRITSTLLRGLESLPWTVVIVACTNLRDNLDPAVFRRFHHHIAMTMPDAATLLAYVRNLAGRYACQVPTWGTLGDTFASAEMAVQSQAKREIIARCAK